MAEYCIMPRSYLYETERRPGLERHEVFFGRGRRGKSIELGLVIFIPPERHRGRMGVHQNRALDLKIKQIGQQAAMDRYGWTIEEFVAEFGRNYL